MKPKSPPPPTYAFGYLVPPESGNAINGVGETQKRRARQVFHSSTGEPMAWKALDDFFSLINPLRTVHHVLANTWQLRLSDGPVHPRRREVVDPSAITAEIKALARSLGAALVGVAEVQEDSLFEGRDPRGEQKWYVDFDKCIPYFVKTFGCAICIEVCPWSEPGKGPSLSARVLALRPPRR
jgi:hypothetical protein